VYDYIKNHKINVKLNKGQPFEPILALIYMLPEQNFGLLPKIIADALKKPSCELRSPIEYFPKKFRLDKY
jgi:5'-3' exonuclease